MSDEAYCMYCESRLDPRDRFCPECGSPILSQDPYLTEPPLSDSAESKAVPASAEYIPPVSPRRADEKFCSQCGMKILALAEICPQCGVRQTYPPHPAMVQYRDWIAVVILSVVTLGIYGVYWIVSTKNEMVAMGADIPTAWLLIIPIANIYFIWKYAQVVEFISEGAIYGVLQFVLWLVFFPAAVYMAQTELNRHTIA